MMEEKLQKKRQKFRKKKEKITGFLKSKENMVGKYLKEQSLQRKLNGTIRGFPAEPILKSRNALWITDFTEKNESYLKKTLTSTKDASQNVCKSAESEVSNIFTDKRIERKIKVVKRKHSKRVNEVTFPVKELLHFGVLKNIQLQKL